MRLLRTSAVDEVRRIPTEDEERRAAREQERRDKRLRIAMKAPWPELKRSDLEFSRFTVKHLPTGDTFRPMVGEVDAQHCPAVAYYHDTADQVVFLERA